MIQIFVFNKTHLDIVAQQIANMLDDDHISMALIFVFIIPFNFSDGMWPTGLQKFPKCRFSHRFGSVVTYSKNGHAGRGKIPSNVRSDEHSQCTHLNPICTYGKQVTWVTSGFLSQRTNDRAAVHAMASSSPNTYQSQTTSIEGHHNQDWCHIGEPIQEVREIIKITKSGVDQLNHLKRNKGTWVLETNFSTW